MSRVLRGIKNNFLDLFRRIPEEFEALNGIRAIACVWIVWFHVLVMLGIFQTRKSYLPMSDHWSLFTIRFGFSCVDVFFVLTGFLLLYPYLLKEFRLNKSKQQKKAAESAAAAAVGADGTVTENATAFSFSYDTSAFRSVGICDYWYKRFVVRIWPPLFLALMIFCYLIHPRGMYKFSHLLNPTATRNFLYSEFNITTTSDDEWQESSCWIAPLSFLHINNLLPFGGCMGWTWSLSIQGQFYFLFPILLRLTKRARYLMWICVLIMAGNMYARWYSVTTYAHLLDRPPPIPTETVDDYKRYLSWFTYFYSPTTNRMGSIAIGMFVAYLQARLAVNDATESRTVRVVRAYRNFPAVLHVGVCALACYSLMRHKDWENTPFYLIMEFIGGPIFSLAFAYLMFIAVNSISVVGRSINWFLSWGVWIPISKVSYSVYLLHCAVIVYGYRTYFHPECHTGDIVFLWKAIAVNTVVVFAGCVLLYVFVEKPLCDLLASFVGGKKPTVAVVAATVSPKAAATKQE